MKLKLKPWQLGLIVAVGVAVLGGAGVGIYFGVNHAIDSAVDESLNSVIETMTTTSEEPPLDESESDSETPVQTSENDEPKTKTEDSPAPQISKEPETMIAYVEPSTTEPITWELDPALSEEVSRLMNERFPSAIWDKSIDRPASPENFVKGDHIDEINNMSIFTGKAGNNTAEEIVDAWTECNLTYFVDDRRYNILVYRYKGLGEGYIFAAVR